MSSLSKNLCYSFQMFKLKWQESLINQLLSYQMVKILYFITYVTLTSRWFCVMGCYDGAFSWDFLCKNFWEFLLLSPVRIWFQWYLCPAPLLLPDHFFCSWLRSPVSSMCIGGLHKIHIWWSFLYNTYLYASRNVGMVCEKQRKRGNQLRISTLFICGPIHKIDELVILLYWFCVWGAISVN